MAERDPLRARPRRRLPRLPRGRADGGPPDRARPALRHGRTRTGGPRSVPWGFRLTPASGLGSCCWPPSWPRVVGGALLVGSRLTLDPPREGLAVALVPTGVEVLSLGRTDSGKVVADGNGVLWAHDFNGRLVRFDPTTGSERMWTVSDDAAFASFDVMPARTGGVWLIGTRTLRWFAAASAGHRDARKPRDRPDHRHRGPRRQPVGGGFGRDSPALGRVIVEHARRAARDHHGLCATGCALLPERDRGRPGRASLGRLGSVSLPARRRLGLTVRRLGGPSSTSGDPWRPYHEQARSITPLPDGSILVARDDGLKQFDGQSVDRRDGLVQAAIAHRPWPTRLTEPPGAWAPARPRAPWPCGDTTAAPGLRRERQMARQGQPRGRRSHDERDIRRRH